MKHILIIGLIVLAFTLCALRSAPCSPFLVCDPQTGVTLYKLTGPAWVPTSVPAQADGSLKMDVATSTVGSNSLTVSACWTSLEWGEQCSDVVPFVFIRPSKPIIPGNIKLKP